jgi:hypothetical protein
MAGETGMARKEWIMTKSAKSGLCTALVVLAAGSAWAGSEPVGNAVATAQPAAWERVGEGSAASVPGMAMAGRSRLAGPGQARLQARKAEMVRRMFWIVLAHR